MEDLRLSRLLHSASEKVQWQSKDVLGEQQSREGLSRNCTHLITLDCRASKRRSPGLHSGSLNQQ